MDILVVGATGVVGSELVRQLAAAGHRPRALVRSAARADEVADLATPVIGDLASPSSLREAFTGAERVFVLSPPTPDMETLERHAFDAAMQAGARRIVYLSNYGAGQFDGPHYHAHGVNERLLSRLDLDWTVLRPTRFMTHTPFTWAPVLDRGVLLETGGAGAMTVIDPADIAAVALKALIEDGHEGATYTLTSEDSFTARDLARTLSSALNREITIFAGDAHALAAMFVSCGVPEAYAPLMAGYFTTISAGLWHVTDSVPAILGRKPQSYAQWLEKNLPRILASTSP